MEFCKYCGEKMMSQGNEKLGMEYIKLYICTKCQGVYEKKTDANGKFKSEAWWNPKTKDYDK